MRRPHRASVGRGSAPIREVSNRHTRDSTGPSLSTRRSNRCDGVALTCPILDLTANPSRERRVSQCDPAEIDVLPNPPLQYIKAARRAACPRYAAGRFAAEFGGSRQVR